MITPLHDEYLVIRKDSSFLILARAGDRFSVCIETPNDEYCQLIDPDDIIAVSAPEGGDIEAGAMLIELLRRHHTPLIVLPHNHPGSRRLRYVISAGPVIETNCRIMRGTHPEQQVICASAGLSGLILRGMVGGIVIENLPQEAVIERFRTDFTMQRAADVNGT